MLKEQGNRLYCVIFYVKKVGLMALDVLYIELEF